MKKSICLLPILTCLVLLSCNTIGFKLKPLDDDLQRNTNFKLEYDIYRLTNVGDLNIIVAALKNQENDKIDSLRLFFDAFLINEQGEIKESDFSKVLEIAVKNRSQKQIDQFSFLKQKSNSDFVFFTQGTGLWDSIWGLVLVDDSLRVKNTVIDHKGETPGLGAEIKSESFCKQFIGSKINFQEPIYKLSKSGKSPLGDEVIDGITGASISCEGVVYMMNSSLVRYEKCFD